MTDESNTINNLDKCPAIKKIFTEFRSAPQPKHEFVIMSDCGQPILVDLAQLERDEKEHKKKKEETENNESTRTNYQIE